MSLMIWTLGLGIALSAVEILPVDSSELAPNIGLAIVGVLALHRVRRIRQSAGQPHIERRTVGELYM